MLVDNITLIVKAGNGGNGAATFMRNSQTAKGGPDGGNGGNGGNIYFQGSHNITDLAQFRYKKKISSKDGIPGKKKNLYGKNADHTTIFVPIGTRITDKTSGVAFEIIDSKTAMVLAKGGKGGRGNNEFKTATNQSPSHAEAGTQGETKELELTLRLIADIGLVGLPNAGKSSLLAALTRAKPKIGNYPFTTLSPHIGMFEIYPVADIPGIIKDASIGRGLGAEFLRHVEKTKILVHCIDATSKNPLEDYKIVRREFKKFNTLLLKKQEVVILTKADLSDKKSLKINKKQFNNQQVFTCSIYLPYTIETLKQKLKNMLSE